jgi:lysophospholipase L1-like esterase
VLLMIGTNDVNHAHQLADAPNRVGLLLDRITGTSPDALVVVAQLVPPGDRARIPSYQAYNAGVVEQCRRRSDAGKHVLTVDMYGAFTANPSYASALIADGIHPNSDGYAVMARTWYPAIRDLLPASR